MNQNEYLDFIRATLARDGLKVADAANKKALELKKISIYQYLAAARILAAEIIAR